MAYRIMTFDGGGVRGVYTAVLLQRVCEAVPGLLDRTQLLAGTSTGGIIALGLASGRTPAELVSLYQDNASKIFDDSWLHELADLHGVSGAEYENANLISILTTLFKSTRLEQLSKKVLVPSFQLDNQAAQAGKRKWKPKFFHNYPGPESDGLELVVDVALRTSAAPVYFPSYQVYVDGGVVANDPSLAAVAQAIDKNTGAQKLEDLVLFSLGTGTNPTYIAGHDLDWGIAQWAKPLVSLMIDGVMGVAEYQCRRLLPTRYFRLQPELPKPIALDDASAVDVLVQSAKDVDISDAVNWLKTVFTAA
jgi:patatin-like phospholipase/acyl hydrolase